MCQAYSQTGIDKGDKAKKARFLFKISAFWLEERYLDRGNKRGFGP
jgi:hypothetical protein